MKKIFLSYSCNETDKTFVENLQKELQLHGDKVINVEDSINYGQNIVDTLHDYIKNCDLIIAILGNSLNVAYETGYAIGKNKKTLIVTDNIYSVPFNLTTVPCISIRNSDKNSYDYSGTIHDILNFIDNMDNYKPIILTTNYDSLIEDYLKNENKTHQAESKKLKSQTIKKLIMFDEVDSKEFEEFISDLLKSRFELIRAKKDNIGYDFILYNYKKFNKTLVEVKHQNINNKVSVGQLQKFLDAIYFDKADYGIFVSSSGFTRSARDFAENSTPKLELWDINTIITLKSEQFKID